MRMSGIARLFCLTIQSTKYQRGTAANFLVTSRVVSDIQCVFKAEDNTLEIRAAREDIGADKYLASHLGGFATTPFSCRYYSTTLQDRFCLISIDIGSNRWHVQTVRGPAAVTALHFKLTVGRM